MSPWLEACRASVADIRGVLADLPTRAEREPVAKVGEGGDDTTAIDAAAEAVVIARLAQVEEGFTLVSEELGEASYGSGGPWRVVVDPIDGSLNAKRDIPFFSLSIAVADGADDGRRLLRLRLRLRLGRGVDGDARRRRAAERARAWRGPPEGRDRDPLLRGDDDRRGRRQGRGRRRSRVSPADHGLARDLALPSRRRPSRRRLLAEACPLGRHRRGAAPRAGSRARDRPLRGTPVRGGAARSDRALPRRRGRNARVVRASSLAP